MRAQRHIEGERGQALPLVSLVLVLAGATLLVIATMGRAAVERAQARTAADAAALAGVTGGRSEADAVARANGAVLADFESDATDARVEVSVGEARAGARARVEFDSRSGAGTFPVGGGDRVGLAPSMLAAVARADALLGRPVPVVSGYRSPAEQAALWARRGSNPYPVAPPGSSRNEQGLAIDVPSSFVDDLLAVAAAAGLCQPMPRTDPVHFEQCPLTSPP